MKTIFINYITKYPIIYIFFCFVLLGFSSYVLFPDKDYSDMENRYLAKCPRITWNSIADGRFMNEFETYVEEQLGFRDAFVKVKAVSETVLFKCENNGIARGKEGFLFEKKLNTSPQLDKNIAAIVQFVKKTQRNVYILIAPTSSYVYREYVPMGMPVLDEENAQIKLSDALKTYKNAHVIDLKDAFKTAAGESLYYKTDHHWRTNAAYQVYKILGSKLNYDAVEYDKYGISSVDDFYGTYYAKYKGVGVVSDVIEYPTILIDTYDDGKAVHDNLYDFDKIGVYDKYAMFMYGNPGVGRITSRVCKNDRSLIVIKNSYANCMLPFLICSYENIITIDPRYCGESIQEIINKNDTAEILMLYDWSFVDEDNHFYKIIK